MLTLEIAGLLDRYGDVFDLNIYRKYREVYIAEVMISNDPMLQDIASYIKSSGFKIPLTSRLFVMIAKIPYLRKMRKKYYKNQ
jgi:hypothetical protein